MAHKVNKFITFKLYISVKTEVMHVMCRRTPLKNEFKLRGPSSFSDSSLAFIIFYHSVETTSRKDEVSLAHLRSGCW